MVSNQKQLICPIIGELFAIAMISLMEYPVAILSYVPKLPIMVSEETQDPMITTIKTCI